MDCKQYIRLVNFQSTVYDYCVSPVYGNEHLPVSFYLSLFFALVLCPFIISHYDYQFIYPSLSSYLSVSLSFYHFYYLCRCWELSAGNIKWIYQVPILTAIGVSKNNVEDTACERCAKLRNCSKTEAILPEEREII